VALPDQPSDVVRWEPQLPKDWREALGKIALFAAQVETSLHRAYWRYLSLSDVEGAIITADATAKRLGEDMIKIARINCKNKRRLADIELLVKECVELFEIRNQCIHWIWSSVINDKSSPARPVYRTKGKAREFDLARLNAMGDQLAWLNVRLTAHSKTDREIRSEIREINSPSLARLFLPAPWLGKSSRPTSKQ
jgi:hypothetical protein